MDTKLQSKNIYQRIVDVMKEVKYVQRESKKINGQYTYTSHDAVTSSLHMPMAENGIVMIPSIAELIQDGNRTMVKMEISFVNSDDPQDRFVVCSYGYGIDQQDKGIGKAVSYAVKYALLKTFCLETGDDVEKDLIDYAPSSVSPEMINARKKMLFESIGKDAMISEFFEKMSKTYKKPIDTIVMQYEDVNKFQSDFASWKENQLKKTG